jgi:hypothetical protein
MMEIAENEEGVVGDIAFDWQGDQAVNQAINNEEGLAMLNGRVSRQETYS